MTGVRGLGAAGLRSWNRYWFRDVDGLPLGAVRIGVAVAGVILWLGMAPQIVHFYTNAGEWPIEAARTWSSDWIPRFLMPDFMGAIVPTVALFSVWGAALTALLVGWRTSAVVWVNWLCTMWFLNRNGTFNNGGDEVFRLVSLYLAIAFLVVPPAHRALSLDRRRATGSFDGPTTVPSWTIRMVQIQIMVVYLVSGAWKMVGPPWWDGSALYVALDNPAFSRFGVPRADWLRIPFTVATVSVALWEFLFPLLVSTPRLRRPALWFGTSLHLGILVFMSIGIFPFIMLGCYPAFMTAGEIRSGFVRRALQVKAATRRSAASVVSS